MANSDQQEILIALGGNLPSRLGGPDVTLLAAMEAIADHDMITIAARSSLYRSVAVPASDQPDFVNAVIGGTTSLPAPELLQLLHQIEADFGRTRDQRWEARILDLDLLDWGGVVIDPGSIAHEVTKRPLALPHPALQDRPFVLLPLVEIAPRWKHPQLGKTAEDLLDDLPKPWNTDLFA